MAIIFGITTYALSTALSALGLIGVFGAIALVSPRMFASLAKGGGRWLDTSHVLATLDKRVDVDDRVLPHSRLLGVAVLASVALLTWLVIAHA